MLWEGSGAEIAEQAREGKIGTEVGERSGDCGVTIPISRCWGGGKVGGSRDDVDVEGDDLRFELKQMSDEEQLGVYRGGFRFLEESAGR